MRCLSCNIILTDEEQRRKSTVTGDYFDLCNKCLGTIVDTIHPSITPEDRLWDDPNDDEDEMPSDS